MLLLTSASAWTSKRATSRWSFSSCRSFNIAGICNASSNSLAGSACQSSTVQWGPANHIPTIWSSRLLKHLFKCSWVIAQACSNHPCVFHRLPQVLAAKILTRPSGLWLVPRKTTRHLEFRETNLSCQRLLHFLASFCLHSHPELQVPHLTLLNRQSTWAVARAWCQTGTRKSGTYLGERMMQVMDWSLSKQPGRFKVTVKDGIKVFTKSIKIYKDIVYVQSRLLGTTITNTQLWCVYSDLASFRQPCVCVKILISVSNNKSTNRSKQFLEHPARSIII